MYHYVLAALKQETASSILDIIGRPRTSGKYKELKTCLLDIISTSDGERETKLRHATTRQPKTVDADFRKEIYCRLPRVMLSLKRVVLEELRENIRSKLTDENVNDLKAL
ncbi:hypothetical protein RF11_15442 [Thelohanellus kitauei]|uniref:DUF7041 domain-containing protein n=1 Tax=Thelohanellus kitauei TaxID=669202 RepID=A0A0C2MBR2_THEKT|nr:hypothetical protein RF11_15442 [Thelohanellus kitauei]